MYALGCLSKILNEILNMMMMFATNSLMPFGKKALTKTLEVAFWGRGRVRHPKEHNPGPALPSIWATDLHDRMAQRAGRQNGYVQ
jgi:hypothetical protein